MKNIPARIRTLVASSHDLVAATAAWVLAFTLRFNFDIPGAVFEQMIGNLLWIVPLQAAVFYSFGLYRGIWRFASIPDLRRIMLAAATVGLAIPTVLLMLQRMGDVPRSVLIMHPLLLVLLMGGSRFLYRAWRDGQLVSPRRIDAEPVIVLGAGVASATLLRDLTVSLRWRVVGLLDDDVKKLGRELHGVAVFGPIDQLPRFAAKHHVTTAIVAMPSASAAARRRTVERAVTAGLKVLTMPSFDDVMSGRVAASDVRQVELEDLLGRDAVQLDERGMREWIANSSVLVTGAGGSIGSELCRQVKRFTPSRMVAVEQSEFALYRIGEELHLPADCLDIADVKDVARLQTVFDTHRPALVFHAAAYKHVPLMEAGNAWAAVRNNVLGTLVTARVAVQAGANEFVLISTDKAVNPTNVMGATKRLAERVCQCLQTQTNATRFVIVRFGNVLGSSGSVIPKFREQIAAGGPVTVTHPDIIRYFMLIPEAAQLVLQAGLMGKAGEVFVLDMGEPVKIADLARDMIRLSGFTEDEIQIEFSGLRPGEKLYEELLADGETTLLTPHPKLRIARPETVPDLAWLDELEEWLCAPWRSETEVKASLQHWVPEYRPAEH